jgi:hypothetical protein
MEDSVEFASTHAPHAQVLLSVTPASLDTLLTIKIFADLRSPLVKTETVQLETTSLTTTLAKTVTHPVKLVSEETVTSA